MKVRAIKTWQEKTRTGCHWVQPGDVFEMDNIYALTYLEAGLVVPVRKREIETTICKAPETQVTR